MMPIPALNASLHPATVAADWLAISRRIKAFSRLVGPGGHALELRPPHSSHKTQMKPASPSATQSRTECPTCIMGLDGI